MYIAPSGQTEGARIAMEYAAVLDAKVIGRTSTNFALVEFRFMQADQPSETGAVSISLALHPRHARMLVEELHSLLEEPLSED